MHSTGDGNAKIPRPTQIAMLKFCAQRAAQRLPQDAPERRTGARKKRPLERARARNQGVVVVVVGLSDSEKAFIGPMGNGFMCRSLRRKAQAPWDLVLRGRPRSWVSPGRGGGSRGSL